MHEPGLQKPVIFPMRTDSTYIVIADLLEVLIYLVAGGGEEGISAR